MAYSARSMALLVLGLLIVLAVTGCAGSTVDTRVPESTESPGAAFVEQRCSMCHTLERVYAASYDKAGWTETVDRMVRNGLVLAGDEKQAIIDYLAERN